MIHGLNREFYDKLMKAYDKCEEDVSKHLGRELNDAEMLYITCYFFRNPKETYKHFGLEYNSGMA